VEDADVGLLIPYVVKREESGAFSYQMLDTEPCSKEYIDNHFFPAKERHRKNIDFHMKKMKCLKLNQNPVELIGDFDSFGSSFLAVFLGSCDLLNRATCKTVPEVTDWLKHKYVLMYYTEDKPDEENDGQSQSYSKFVHMPVNRFVDTNHRFMLHEFEYNDEYFYSVKQMPDQALNERMPDNEFVELYENRVGIFFEVDPQHSLIENARLPINFVTQLCNILFLIAFLATFGQLFATKCASRKLHRDLIEILKIKEPPEDCTKPKLTKRQRIYKDIMGGF